MSLKDCFESVRTQVEDALEKSQHLKDESVARILDDVLLRQKFWAEDVGFEQDPYRSMSKQPSDALETTKHLLNLKVLLEELESAILESQKSTMSPLENYEVNGSSQIEPQNLIDKAEGVRLMNDQFCNSEEIFELLERLEDLEVNSSAIKEASGITVPATDVKASTRHLKLPISARTLVAQSENMSTSSSNSLKELLLNMGIPEAMDKLRALITLVEEKKGVPKDIQLGFNIERFRLECWVQRVFLPDKVLSDLSSTTPLVFLQSFLRTVTPYLSERTLPSGASIASESSERSEEQIMLLHTLAIFQSGIKTLESLFDQPERESLRRSLKVCLSTMFLNYGEQTIYLKEAAELLGNKDIERMAQVMNALLPENSDHNLELPIIEADEFKPGLTDEAMSRLKGGDRYVGEYKGKGILVELVDMGGDHPNTSVNRRAEGSAKLLNCDLKAMGLSVLHSIGLVNISHLGAAHILELPDDVTPESFPVTLAELFENYPEKRMPDLSEKFHMAKALVNTLFELHTLGFFHRNLNAQNILLWPSKVLPNRPDFRRPYLVGFGASASDLDLRHRSSRPYLRFYEHIEYTSVPRPTHLNEINRLGFMLLEICACDPISSSFPLNNYSYATARDRALRCADKAGRLMGCRYRDTIAACFDPTLENFHNSGEDRENYLKYFGSRIVDVLAGCNV